jgi:8-oxo-dGTP pyrophosphatase MutT (NUDIX family)|tara:strand:- start:79 stop:831 length:753 start_codon:yes stop_codon:yes gene_type:complete
MDNNYLHEIQTEAADQNEAPSIPIHAATLLLLRDNLNTIEVFMIKRAAASNFGNAWVFPGGKVDKQDIKDEYLSNLKLLNDESDEIKNGYLVAAIRECFEECGVLLANNKLGKLFKISENQEISNLQNFQKKINNKELSFIDMLKQLNIFPAIDALNYFSHWITPETEKKRYSTKFFLANLPKNQKALHDGFEGVESLWISPDKALKLYKSGKFPIIFPTIKSLETLREFTSTKELLKTTFKKNINGKEF